ncbi:L-arabinonate dehydratase [Salinarimonas soli]|uniref:Dihydroxy-acid dehydratase n=1 Tax=Salinarimonas soli TaxID=1638099 RepID=A0A5B2VI80_9HYPH|nr:L-arabinonate dehydratase [Salinarimonas soli]KAA2238052.1 dihydroxy-acid dehydratase [Salinarimonas soli]
MSTRRSPESLRSARWYGASDMRAFAHRQRTQQMGFRRDEFVGRPVIGILNTWSEMSPCHSHLRDRAEAVRRGVIRAGGFPVELPALSLGEVIVKPTTMLYRNMLAMEAEELIRQHPLDGVVLMGGCDKTTPGLVMGAISMGLPCIFLPAGPMLSGRWRGTTIGAGTHTRKYWDEYRAGRITDDDWLELEGISTRSTGTCNTMGTASTMTSIVETLGLCLPGATSIPAVDSSHAKMASAVGERIVDMVWEDLTPNRIVTEASVRNAVEVQAALGGSTNALIHLVAVAARAGVALPLDAFDEAARRTPVLANVFPAGTFLMEDVYFAGGLPALLSRIQDRLDLSCLTVTGRPIGESVGRAKVWDDEVIRPLDRPVTTVPAIAILRGNLCPDGAAMKPSAATPALLNHRGRALVFDSHAELSRRIDDPALDVDETTVLVLRGAGPVGAPGMPEWGALPIPKKLLDRGVRDMVRLSDARMSGTHYGTCVLHIAPESHVGGPLALVRTGDEIVLDVENRRLDMLVDDAELARRREAWTPPAPRYERGYTMLYQRHVSQADKGCDFDFLEAGAPTPEPEIF